MRRLFIALMLLASVILITLEVLQNRSTRSSALNPDACHTLFGCNYMALLCFDYVDGPYLVVASELGFGSNIRIYAGRGYVTFIIKFRVDRATRVKEQILRWGLFEFETEVTSPPYPAKWMSSLPESPTKAELIEYQLDESFEDRWGAYLRATKGIRVTGALPTILVLAILLSYPIIFYVRGPMRRQYRRGLGLCVHCAYNLQSISSTNCPECGQKFDTADILESGEHATFPNQITKFLVKLLSRSRNRFYFFTIMLLLALFYMVWIGWLRTKLPY